MQTMAAFLVVVLWGNWSCARRVFERAIALTGEIVIHRLVNDGDTILNLHAIEVAPVLRGLDYRVGLNAAFDFSLLITDKDVAFGR